MVEILSKMEPRVGLGQRDPVQHFAVSDWGKKLHIFS
jgi:hypothetical protein